MCMESHNGLAIARQLKLRANESSSENTCGTLFAGLFGEPNTVRLRNSGITEMLIGTPAWQNDALATCTLHSR